MEDTVSNEDRIIQVNLSWSAPLGQHTEFTKFKKPWTPVRKKGCLVTSEMRKNSKLSPLVQKMLDTYSKNSSREGKKEDSINPRSQITWCASPYSSKQPAGLPVHVECRKESYSTSIPNNMCANTRGKWIIQLGNITSDPINQVWLNVCRLSKKGHLPQCNSKLKERECAIWVYCNLSQATKVLRTKTCLHQARYIVHGQCLIQANGIEVKDTAVSSDR